MSLKSWKKEFYPIGASEVDEQDAVAHSLRKWIGLRQENLDKHDVSHSWDGISYKKDSLPIGAPSCALCQHHYIPKRSCESCPLHEYLGRPCDGDDSPYAAFVDDDGPEPMISALEAIV